MCVKFVVVPWSTSHQHEVRIQTRQAVHTARLEVTYIRKSPLRPVMVASGDLRTVLVREWRLRDASAPAMNRRVLANRVNAPTAQRLLPALYPARSPRRRDCYTPDSRYECEDLDSGEWCSSPGLR